METSFDKKVTEVGESLKLSKSQVPLSYKKSPLSFQVRKDSMKVYPTQCGKTNGITFYVIMQHKQELVLIPKEVVYSIKKITSAIKNSYNLKRNKEIVEDMLFQLCKKIKEKHSVY